jgi:hypothetical protein
MAAQTHSCGPKPQPAMTVPRGAAMTHVSIPPRFCRFGWIATVCLLAAPAVWAQSPGLTFDDRVQFGPRLQARVGVNTSTAPSDGSSASWHQQAGVLLGDYYFSRARLGQGQVSSGFRATSGLMLGQRSLALGTPALAGPQGMAVTQLRQPRSALPAIESASEPWAAVPYIGIGWSGVSVRGGCRPISAFRAAAAETAACASTATSRWTTCCASCASRRWCRWAFPTPFKEEGDDARPCRKAV